MNKLLTLFVVLCFASCCNCQKVIEIKAADAHEIVMNRDTVKTIMIDGRSIEMFKHRHITTAINIDAFQENLTEKLSCHLGVDEMIIYCTRHKRADLIIEKLKGLQYKGKIIFISDGITGWIASGYKTIES